MRKITLLFLLAFVVSCGDDALGPPDELLPGEPGRLIQDALHNGGNPFFFWLAPMVAQPKAELFGTADPAADPVVRIICEAASAASNCPDSEIGAEVASFAAGSGVTFDLDAYQLDFDTKLSYNGYALLSSDVDQGAFTTYQIQVWTGDVMPALIGLASFQLAASGGDVRNLSQPDQVIALKDGRVLPVRFRIDLFAYDYATASSDPCPLGCSSTKIDEEVGGTAYYTDSGSDIALTGVLFEAFDLPTLPEGEDYTLLIGPLATGNEGSILADHERDERDLCAFDVDRAKYDCFRYTLFPDVPQFNKPVRFGICKRTVPPSDHQRLVKVDRSPQDEAIVTFPDPVPVEDFLPCQFPDQLSATGVVERVLQFALDRLVPPLFAQTTVRVWGGMANDFSDIFWTVEDGLISHWTADQLGYFDEATKAFVPTAAADAMGRNPALWEAGVTPSYLSGVSGNAFAFAREGKIVRAPADGWGASPEFTVAAWAYLDPLGPATALQRLVTATGPDGLRAYLHQDDAAPGELGVLRLIMEFPSLAESELTIRVPNVLAQACWQHVAASYDGTSMRLYLNGTEIGSQLVGAPLAAATNLWLSHDFVDGAGLAPASLYGRIDDLVVFDQALTDLSAITSAADCTLVGSVDVTPANRQSMIGGTVQLAATVRDGSAAEIPDLSVQWASSSDNVASVDASGLVTANGPGTATITATTGGVSGSAVVAVQVPPVQLAPEDNAVFDHFPRTTTLQWEPMAGAEHYVLERQFCSPDGCDIWTSDYPAVTVQGTSFTFDFVGAQPGRWRVKAVDAASNETGFSEWRGFRYTI